MSEMKGLGAVFFLLLIGVIVMISIWLFFTFFKVHITGIAVDVESINRYQEVPTLLLSSHLYSESRCSNGEGPAGTHDPNVGLCNKNLAFFYNNQKASGKEILTEETESVESYTNNVRLSLPSYCYKIYFSEGDEEIVLMDGSKEKPRTRAGTVNINCNMGQPKINEIYPLPTFSNGAPFIANQYLFIGSSATSSEKLLSNWPIYGVVFDFGGD